LLGIDAVEMGSDGGDDVDDGDDDGGDDGDALNCWSDWALIASM